MDMSLEYMDFRRLIFIEMFIFFKDHFLNISVTLSARCLG